MTSAEHSVLRSEVLTAARRPVTGLVSGDHHGITSRIKSAQPGKRPAMA